MLWEKNILLKIENKVALIDIDGTLLSGQSQVHLIFYLYSEKAISLSTFLKVIIWYLKYKFFSAKIDERMVGKIYSSLLAGKKEVEIEKIVNDFFEKKLVKEIYPGALVFVNNLKEENYRILLISASIFPICSIIKKYFNADGLICTKLEIKDGVYTGKIEGKINEGSEKKNRVLRYLEENSFNLKNSVAMGDRMSDLEILKLAERPIAVNPEKMLKKYAIRQNWEILIY